MSDAMEPAALPSEPAIEHSSTPSSEGQSPAQVAPEAPPTSATAENPGAEQAEDDTPAWAKKRFGELTAKLRAAERRAEMAELAAVANRPPQQPTQQAQPAAPAQLPPDLAQFVGPEPKAADFAAGEYDPEYGRAIARYESKAAQASMELHRRGATQQQHQAEFSRRVSSVVDEARAAGEDVAAALSDPHFPMPQHVVAAVMEGEKPAAVLAHLAMHPEEAARIAGLRPLSAARALERIEARLSAAPPPPVTAAPPPPRTLRGASSNSSPDPSSMTMEQYADWAAKRGW